MVERFDLDEGGFLGERGRMEPSADGDYVFYSDYADLERENAELRAEREPDLMMSEWRDAFARAERAEEAFEIARADRVRLESALQFYADPDNYVNRCLDVQRTRLGGADPTIAISGIGKAPHGRALSDIQMDRFGGRARAALSGSSDPRKDVAREGSHG